MHANDGANDDVNGANGVNDAAHDDDHLDQDKLGPLRHQRHQSVQAMHANADLWLNLCEYELELEY